MSITLEQAIERIAEELCKREKAYRAASIENGQDIIDPEDWFGFDVISGDMGEMLQEAYSAKLQQNK